MQIVNINALPSQTFTVLLDDNQWDISLIVASDAICATMVLNGTTVIENIRVVAGMRIIPSKYEESGNFALITQNNQIPDYNQFGITQTLVYISQDELDALRVPNTGIITDADFDPNGGFSLRYKPQGYTLA